MKLAFSFALACLIATSLFAQAPTNDGFDCATMVDLGVAPACQPSVYSNVNATPSVIATVDTVPCFNSATAQHDVWFKFICSDTLFDYRIYLKSAGGDPIVNPEFAIYRGDCEFNGLGLIGCVSAQPGQDSISVDLFDLTPNEVYYIRVSDWSATAAPNSGQFVLCVDEIPPILTIGQGGSMLCNGTLYDTGGATGDYQANEDLTFVICPDQPSECIAFTLEYYDLEPSPPFNAGLGDQLYFYDGPNVNSPLLAALDGNGFAQQNIAGGGGVCFRVNATSGCLTVRFKSDGSVQESGWKGTWACSSDPCIQEEQISIDTSIVNADIEGATSTGGAMVTVTSVNCPQGGMGTFSYPSDNNSLQMTKGILLTSGQALNAIGPNFFGGNGSQNEPLFADDPGDVDLQYLSDEYGGGSTSYDVCSVELDVFAATNEVVFEYVFGSEEYPEYVNSAGGYNDIFAFLVSGPGIAGDPNLTNSALNIATLPTTGTFVQIDSVNNLVNWQYYRNNELSQTLEYDGLTSDYLGVKKSLTARVPVTPCNTYHLKLAIADRGDESYDSGVFVSEIKAGSPDIEIAFSSGVDYFIENCTGTNDTLFITLSKVPTVATTFNITIGGTATQGSDYILNIPPSITFQPGQQTLAFPIIPIADNIPEGPEFVSIALSRNYGCGEVTLKVLKVDILDNVLVQVDGGDTLNVCVGDFLQLHATGATNYLWEPVNLVSNPYIADPFTSPTQSAWLTLTGSVGACVDVDSVFIRVIAPTIDATNLTTNTICLGSSVQLQATSSESQIVWSPADGLSDANSPNPVATPTSSVTYTASVTLEGCTVQDAVTITVDTLHFPNVINDLVQCQNFPINLANNLNTTTQYLWTPATGLSDPTVSGPVALPDVTTTYILTATSNHNACSKMDTVTVTVTPADVNILGMDSLKICLGEIVNLSAQVNPAGSIVHWTPSDYLNLTTGLDVTATPEESITYIASYEINGCPPVLDSVFIKVDSLPDLTLRLVPNKPFYCPGDTIYILSNTYEPGNFPGIQHAWQPFGTQLTPLDNWNMIIVATDTNIYRRATIIGGCEDIAEILVPVPNPPDLTSTVTPNPICPGESAQIVVTVSPANTTLEWEPSTATTLSCDHCANPVASPLMTTSYHVTTPDAECPSGIDVTVEVRPLPILDLAVNPESCAGAPVVLNSTNEAGVTYTWTPPTNLNNPSAGNPTATPTQAGATTYHVNADREGCNVEGTVTLTAYFADVTITTPPQTVCAGTPITLTATTTGTPGTLLWMPAGPNITPTASKRYYAALVYGSNCAAEDSVDIDVIQLPTLNLTGPTSVCLGTPVNLSATNDPGVQYVWTPTNGLNNPNIGNPSATPLVTTTYHVVATSNIGGCKAEGDVPVTVANATVDLGPDQSVCFGTPVTLTATITGTLGGEITWPGIANAVGPTVTVSPSLDQSFTVNYNYGPNNLCSDSDVINLMVSDSMKLGKITGPTDSVCAGAQVKLKIAVLFGTGTLSWLADGTPITGAKADSILVQPQGGTVSYQAVLTDASGCSVVSDPFEVKTKKCFGIPNAFTPNGDEANDTFGPLYPEGSAEILSFEIYNRWGQKVFEATPQIPKWDGKIGGTPASSDVYVYKLHVRFGNGDETTESGEVTLLR